MEFFLNHIWYIIATLITGIVVGWATNPFYERIKAKLNLNERRK